jgi:hypothetical protein
MCICSLIIPSNEHRIQLFGCQGIGGIAGGNQSDGWDVKARRIIGVCMTDLDYDQLVSFQVDLIALHRIGDRRRRPALFR